MGLMTGLLLGGLLTGAGWLKAKHDENSESASAKKRRIATEGMTPEERYQFIRPAGDRIGTGRAVDRDSILSPAAQAAEDAPPSAELAESENTGEAIRASNRTRRRARGGNSGKVTTGPTGVGTGAGGAPRTLIGT